MWSQKWKDEARRGKFENKQAIPNREKADLCPRPESEKKHRNSQEKKLNFMNVFDEYTNINTNYYLYW